MCIGGGRGTTITISKNLSERVRPLLGRQGETDTRALIVVKTTGLSFVRRADTRVLYNVVVGRHRLVCSGRRPATSIPATHIQDAPREQAYFYRSYLSACKNGKRVWGGVTIDYTPFELLVIAILVWTLKQTVFAYKTYARTNNSAVNIRRIEGHFQLHFRVDRHGLVQSFRNGSFVR